MINSYLVQFKTWFESRNLREKVLVIGLTWSLIYAIFSLVAINQLDSTGAEHEKTLKQAEDTATNWESQLQYLANIPNSSLYKEWAKEHETFSKLKDQYKNLLQKSATDKWDKIIKTVLASYPNITLVKITNHPEKAFVTSKIQTAPNSIFQQQVSLSVLGNFNDVVDYLTSLEVAMPSIHWDTLNYSVTTYPLAQVDMEFSILYEKS